MGNAIPAPPRPARPHLQLYLSYRISTPPLLAPHTALSRITAVTFHVVVGASTAAAFGRFLIFLLLLLIAAISGTAAYIFYRSHRSQFSITSFRIHRLNLTASADSSSFQCSCSLICLSTQPSAHTEEVAMAAVIKKFFITSMFMWMAPIAILYAFNNDLIPGVTHLSPHSLTLFSGFVAVISVNIVIAFYIYLAMKEPSDKREPEPDPKFLSEAKASVSKLVGKAEDSTQALKKEE